MNSYHIARIECSCGHKWATRKPLEEIETLRCSSCGTASKDALSISEDASQQTQDSSIVTEVEAGAKREDLLERVESLVDRVEGTAPDEAEYEAATEVRGEYNRLRRLRFVLEEGDEDISLDELQATADYVDSIETCVDDHADQLDRVDDLQSSVENLESTVSELRHERTSLKAEIGELQDDLEQLSRSRDKLEKRVGELREDASVYSQGYEKGLEHAEITIPCAQCGGPVRMEPDSQIHRAAIDLLQGDGWGHPSCISDSKPRAGQGSW